LQPAIRRHAADRLLRVAKAPVATVRRHP
jgi:hypothetical protein